MIKIDAQEFLGEIQKKYNEVKEAKDSHKKIEILSVIEGMSIVMTLDQDEDFALDGNNLLEMIKHEKKEIAKKFYEIE